MAYTSNTMSDICLPIVSVLFIPQSNAVQQKYNTDHTCNLKLQVVHIIFLFDSISLCNRENMPYFRLSVNCGALTMYIKPSVYIGQLLDLAVALPQSN